MVDKVELTKAELDKYSIVIADCEADLLMHEALIKMPGRRRENIAEDVNAYRIVKERLLKHEVDYKITRSVYIKERMKQFKAIDDE